MQKNYLVEYAVIGAYFVFMILTGVAFRRFNRNFSDYFRSGCRGTWWLVGSSIFMAGFTAWTFTGASGVAYETGLAVSIIFFANSVGYMINALVTAPFFRQMRATTGPEIIRQRFDIPTQQFYVWITMIPGILTSGLTLWGVALFASSIFGYDLQKLMIILGTVVVIYSTLGGSWSVMATDFLQALILVPMTVLVFILSMNSIGWFDGISQQLHAQNLTKMLNLTAEGTDFTPWYAIAMFCFVQVSYNSFTASHKYFACKDGREARKAALLASVLQIVGCALWFFPPIVARLQFSDLVAATRIAHPAEASYAVLATKLLPSGMTGMIVVAMFAATMSTLGPLLNQYAAIITQDVYKAFVRPKSSDREVFLVGQISSVCMGVLIILAALVLAKTKISLFKYMMTFGSVFGTPTLVPMFLALFLRKAPPYAALVSVLCSLPFSVLSLHNKWSYELTVFSILAAGTLGYVATMPLWKYVTEENKKRIEDFYRRMHTPVDFEKEIGRPNDGAQLQLVGWVSASIGFFMLLILLVPNPPAARLQVLAVAGSILAFGLVLVFLGKRSIGKLARRDVLDLKEGAEEKEGLVGGEKR